MFKIMTFFFYFNMIKISLIVPEMRKIICTYTAKPQKIPSINRVSKSIKLLVSQIYYNRSYYLDITSNKNEVGYKQIIPIILYSDIDRINPLILLQDYHFFIKFVTDA